MIIVTLNKYNKSLARRTEQNEIDLENAIGKMNGKIGTHFSANGSFLIIFRNKKLTLTWKLSSILEHDLWS